MCPSHDDVGGLFFDFEPFPRAGDLADTLTKSPRETRDAPRKDMFGGVIVVWPKLVEVSLCGALGCGGRLVRAALDQAKRDGMECVVRPRRRISRHRRASSPREVVTRDPHAGLTS